MPSTLRDALSHNDVQGLLTLPDGELWSIPWHAAGSLRRVATVVSPSLSLWSQIPQPAEDVSSVPAFIDEAIQGADIVVTALKTLQRGGCHVSRGHSPADLQRAHKHDLLLIFCHGGGGPGLDYHLALPGGQTTMLDLAQQEPGNLALIAACWSGAKPASAFPMSAPISLLVGGYSTVVGGLWPLPSIPTAEIVADALLRLTSGADLRSAILSSRSAPGHLMDTAGLAVFGRL